MQPKSEQKDLLNLTKAKVSNTLTNTSDVKLVRPVRNNLRTAA